MTAKKTHIEDTEKQSCKCNEENTNHSDCKCGGKHKHKEDCKCTDEHNYEGHCDCGDDCGCGEGCDCGCGEDCDCGDDCGCCCDDECDCGCENIADAKGKQDLAIEYLNLARTIQADFENYRKRSLEAVAMAKVDGMIEAIEVILPALDVFAKAKIMIKDENALKGIEMVENEIASALSGLGVEKIATEGCDFNPNFHCALSCIEDKTKKDNIILQEYQSGYKFKDKVIKYSQVIVNKIKEEK